MRLRRLLKNRAVGRIAELVEPFHGGVELAEVAASKLSGARVVVLAFQEVDGDLQFGNRLA